jgi:hypothetical protein
MTHSQVIKANWKNRVISQIDFLKENNRFDGSFNTLKSIVKMMIELEVKNYNEWKIRNSKDFKDTITNKLY